MRIESFDDLHSGLSSLQKPFKGIGKKCGNWSEVKSLSTYLHAKIEGAFSMINCNKTFQNSGCTTSKKSLTWWRYHSDASSFNRCICNFDRHCTFYKWRNSSIWNLLDSWVIVSLIFKIERCLFTSKTRNFWIWVPVRTRSWRSALKTEKHSCWNPNSVKHLTLSWAKTRHSCFFHHSWQVLSFYIFDTFYPFDFADLGN